MDSIGTTGPRAAQDSRKRGPGAPFWFTVIGMAVLVIIFVTAILQAAHESSVLGWILAAIALGWLALAAYALLLVRGTLRFGRSAVENFEEQMRSASGRAPAAQTLPVQDAGSLRDQKIEHSFQIVLVQNRVIKEQLDRGSAADREIIDRAVDTIDFTAKNGKGLVRAQEPLSGDVLD